MAGLGLVQVDRDIDNAPDWYVRKNTLAMYENDIKKELSKINDSFAYIGMKLSEIQEYGLYTSLSIADNGTVRACNNVAEWALAVLDISKSTTYNLIGVYERFCRSDGFLAEAWKKYSFSQLCEMLRAPYADFDTFGFDPLMTCREIRERIRSANGVSLDVKTEKVEKQQAGKETLPISQEHSEVEMIAESHEPEDTSGTVYVHFADEIEFTRWYYDNFDKAERYPLAVSYHVSGNSEL